MRVRKFGSSWNFREICIKFRHAFQMIQTIRKNFFGHIVSSGGFVNTTWLKSEKNLIFNNVRLSQISQILLLQITNNSEKKHFEIFEQINNKPKGCCYNCLSRSINCVETLQLANIDLKFTSHLQIITWTCVNQLPDIALPKTICVPNM